MKSFSLSILLVCIYFFAGAQKRYIPLRINSSITLDGHLNEDAWKQAVVLNDFMQTDPTPGAKPTEKTEVQMVYNNEYLFVAFHCYDSTPSKIVRLFMDRDFQLGKDDGISVQLDTYNDKSTAVVFITNTLSARFDSEISNNGDGMNDDYNNFWDAVSVVDSTGYSSEFRIPFSSLRFEQKEKTVMGFRFARLIKRKNELITYPKCDSSLSNQWNNVSQEAELEFTNLKTKKPVYFTPYIIGNYNQQNHFNNDSSAYMSSNKFFSRKFYSNNETLDKIISNIGADLKYGLTKNFTLNLTLNTDYAQAEVDNRIINLSKYAVYIPEKRSFFLESQNYLSYSVGQSTQLFNSRVIGLDNDVIVPIIAGVRIAGKQNGWQVAALNMQTGDVKSENIEAQNFSAMRFRKFYGDKGSFAGGIFTNRSSTNSNSVSNQSTGIDMVHHFTDKWLAGFGLSSTYDHEQKDFLNKNMFVNIFAFKNANEGFTHGLDFELAGDKFNPAMGFNPETDYGYLALSNGKKIKVKGEHAINFWRVNTNLSYRWKLLSQQTETRFANFEAGMSWKKGSNLSTTPAEYKEDRLFDNWSLSDHITIPAGYYHMFLSDIDFFYDESKNITAEIYFKQGDFYGGKLYRTTEDVNYIFNRYLRTGVHYEHNQIYFPNQFSDDGHKAVYISNLVSGNFSVSFSSKFSIKLLAQYDDDSNSFGGNLRIRYNPREGDDLYIVFNSAVNTNRLEAKPKLPLIDQQAIVIKYSKTFGL